MEGAPSRTYPSENVLGDLFRVIDPVPIFEPLADGFCDPRLERFASTIPIRYFRQAGAAKRSYDVELQGIMQREPTTPTSK